MNVMPAWRSCANGTGVIVGVVDSGVQNHVDLDIDRSLNDDYNKGSNNIMRAREWQKNWSDNGDYIQNIWNYRLRYENSLKHGTRAAGIVAAKKNNIGIIGVAFGAKIADIRISSSSRFLSFNATLLRHNSHVIDVYSCSFANVHTGTKTYPLLEDQESALRYGTTYGRGKLGSVYVFATGNSGGSDTDIARDSCAYDRLVSNRYVISIAGIQHNLQKLPNGEACSAIMVAAFSAKPGSSHKVFTTEIRNGYTDQFNQNSAAVPMVSGAVALALSVNPNLTYRDIMHLLVNTSRSGFPGFRERTMFNKNAAGLYVSSYFGFGLLDIGSLVERSKSWNNVPKGETCRQNKNFNTPLRRQSNFFVVKVSSCIATYVEHVEVSLKVNHPNAGQIQWVLVSPYGTRSTIIPGRGLDPTKSMNLSVLTVQMWGENPNGYWRLEPTAVFGRNLEHGTLKSVGITIYGFRCRNRKCLQPAQQDRGRWGQWSFWEQCSATCGRGAKSRYRQCIGHSSTKYCIGKSFQTVPCNLPECQSIIRSGKRCPSPQKVFSLCAEHCLTDAHCWGLKCCYNGCGHTCEIPVVYDETPGRQSFYGK